jgi:hypothetical protein
VMEWLPVFLIALSVLAGGLFHLMAMRTGNKITHDPAPTASNTSDARLIIANDDDRQTAKKYLDLAIEQDRNIAGFAPYLVVREIECQADLFAAEPFIDMDFGVINRSIFDLALGQIDGRVRYEGQPLSRELQISSGHPSIPAGHYSRIILRQWLTRDFVERILNISLARLHTGNIGITFNYINHKGHQKKIRLAVPDELFGIAAYRIDIGDAGTVLIDAAFNIPIHTVRGKVSADLKTALVQEGVVSLGSGRDLWRVGTIPTTTMGHFSGPLRSGFLSAFTNISAIVVSGDNKYLSKPTS